MKAGQKIVLEEEIRILLEKLSFEKTLFKMQESGSFKVTEEFAEIPSDDDGDKSFEAIMKKLLKEYAEKFGKEYEMLLLAQVKRENFNLKQKLEEIEKSLKIKLAYYEKQQGKLKKLELKIVAIEGKIKEITGQLDEIEKEKRNLKISNEKERHEKQKLVEQLEKEHKRLAAEIEAVMQAANLAINEIIKIQCEIEFYRKIVEGENDRFDAKSKRMNRSIKSYSRTYSHEWSSTATRTHQGTSTSTAIASASLRRSASGTAFRKLSAVSPIASQSEDSSVIDTVEMNQTVATNITNTTTIVATNGTFKVKNDDGSEASANTDDMMEAIYSKVNDD